MTPRTLSNAEDRRTEVLAAALPVMAEKGIHGTPTLAVAKAAGISQAYLFRLFPTKVDLAVAVVDLCHDRVIAAFRAAAAQARHDGTDAREAMGAAYTDLLGDRDLLLVQLHAHAASPDMPEVREAVRRGFARLLEVVGPALDDDAEQIRSFFAYGMFLNVLAAVDAAHVDAPWAHTLVPPDCLPPA